jgi:hypothetical protein
MTDDETIMVDATTMMIKVNNTMGIIKMIIIVITRGESRMSILKRGGGVDMWCQIHHTKFHNYSK